MLAVLYWYGDARAACLAWPVVGREPAGERKPVGASLGRRRPLPVDEKLEPQEAGAVSPGPDTRNSGRIASEPSEAVAPRRMGNGNVRGAMIRPAGLW